MSIRDEVHRDMTERLWGRMASDDDVLAGILKRFIAINRDSEDVGNGFWLASAESERGGAFLLIDARLELSDEEWAALEPVLNGRTESYD